MRETEHLFNALRFLTVIPVPDTPGEMAPDWLTRAIRYFPVVGIAIGLISALVVMLASAWWGSVISALLAFTASIVVTGALHEDGLADTIDSVGGRTPEKRLAIMKDSRIGSFGALALGLGVALRVAALADVLELSSWAAAAALIATHAAARATPGVVMNTMTYAGDTAAMKVVDAASPVQAREFRWLAVTVAVATLPLMFVSITAVAAGLLCGTLLALALARWAKRSIGGYTGDVLGAIEQVFEIGFLLGVAAALLSSA